MLDAICRRYGMAPHELVTLDGYDFILDLRCCMAGMKRDGPQPVVLVTNK